MENLCSYPSSSGQEAPYVCFGWTRECCVDWKKTLLSKNFFDFKISHIILVRFNFPQACLSDKITDQELATLLNKGHLLAFYWCFVGGIQSDAFLNVLKIVFKHSK